MNNSLHAAFMRLFIVRLIVSRPRLATSMLAGIVAFVVIPETLIHQPVTRAIAAWNIGACLYLALARQLSAPLVTADRKMQQKADRAELGQAIHTLAETDELIAAMGQG